MNTVYIRRRSSQVARTLELPGDVYLDVDDRGGVVGVELLDANAFLDRQHLEVTIPDDIRDIDSACVIG